MASLRPLIYNDDTAWYAMGERYDASLSTLDVVLMRKDPPFDMEFFYTTQLLEDAERRGTLIVNAARAFETAMRSYLRRNSRSAAHPYWYPEIHRT